MDWDEDAHHAEAEGDQADYGDDPLWRESAFPKKRGFESRESDLAICEDFESRVVHEAQDI